MLSSGSNRRVSLQNIGAFDEEVVFILRFWHRLCVINASCSVFSLKTQKLSHRIDMFKTKKGSKKCIFSGLVSCCYSKIGNATKTPYVFRRKSAI